MHFSHGSHAADAVRAQMRQRIVVGHSVLFVWSVLSAALTAGDPIVDPIEIAREANRASAQGLRSGKGSGTFEFYEQNPEQAQPALIQKAKFTAWFAEGKYHVRLDFEKGPLNNLERQIIIYDRSAFFSSKFWPKVVPHPTGSAGYINAGNWKITKPPSVVGFPWDLSRLATHSLDMDGVLQHHPRTSLKMTPVSGNRYRGTLRIGKFTATTFDIDQNSGFNIVRVAVQNDGEESPVQLSEATWKKAGELWYVASAVHQLDLRRAEIPFRRWVMKYDTFEANCEVPPKFFSLDALDLRPGSRILDQRPDAPVPEYYTPGKKTEAAKLDMLVEIQKLPTSRTEVKELRNTLRIGLLWFGGASSLFLIGMGAFLLRKRLRGREAK